MIMMIRVGQEGEDFFIACLQETEVEVGLKHKQWQY